MSSIQLIKSPSTGNAVLADKWYVPLDLIQLGTILESKGHVVEILDGQHLTSSEISGKIDAPIVGINFNILSKSDTDHLAKEAKRKGATVIVGGHAATHVASDLLGHESNVDFVVRYDGELALQRLVERLQNGSKDFSDIPNLVFWKGNEIVETPVAIGDFAETPLPNRRIGGIDMERYIAAFAETNTEKGITGTRVTNAHTKKGCHRGCSFCGRIDRQVRARSPRAAFEEYRSLVEDFDIDYIFDHSDTWVQEDWLEEYSRIYKAEGGLGMRLMVFGDIRDINPETAALLDTIGVDNLLMGVKSGHEGILKRNGKRMSQDQIETAIRLLAERRIKVSASYVLGLIGETRNTACETIDFARRMRDRYGTVVNYCNIVMPLPGTWMWTLMMRVPELFKKYRGRYPFDLSSLRSDYLTHFCNLEAGGEIFLEQGRDTILSHSGLESMEYAR